MIRAIHGDVGLGLVQADENRAIENYVQGLRNSTSVESVKVTHQEPGIYWTEVKQQTVKPGIYSTILETGSMSQLPIIIEQGWQYHQILSPTATSLRRMLTKLKQNFQEVELIRSSNSPNYIPSILTNKQHTTIQLAYEMGYYNLPRGVTIEDIGNSLGISRSACQERLHRAEKEIVSYYLDDYRY